MLNIVETSTKNILPLPFLFVDIKGDFVRGDYVRRYYDRDSPILPPFRDIAGFLLRMTPPLFHPNFRGVPLGLDYRCCGSEERRP